MPVPLCECVLVGSPTPSARVDAPSTATHLYTLQLRRVSTGVRCPPVLTLENENFPGTLRRGVAEVGVKAHRDANLIVIRDPDILVGT
eukprot:6224170-Prymnesium_polylepis.1